MYYDYIYLDKSEKIWCFSPNFHLCVKIAAAILFDMGGYHDNQTYCGVGLTILQLTFRHSKLKLKVILFLFYYLTNNST